MPCADRTEGEEGTGGRHSRDLHISVLRGLQMKLNFKLKLGIL